MARTDAAEERVMSAVMSGINRRGCYKRRYLGHF
jgi:hypothetical protein